MNVIASNVLRILIVPCLIVAIGGCVSTMSVDKELAGWKEAHSSGTQSLVIGRIQWIENGEVKKLGDGVFSLGLTPILLRQEDGSEITGKVDENGEMVLPLKSGKYVINKISIFDPWSGPYDRLTSVTFSVPANGQVYYIGSLKLNFASRRDLIGKLHGYTDVEIEDQGQAGYANIAKTVNIAANTVQTQLMKDEDPAIGSRSLTEMDGEKLRVASEASDRWALDMLQRAAEKGDGNAEFELGLLNANGRAMPQNYLNAAQLWRKAEHQGNMRAYIDLVMLFENDQSMLQLDAAALLRLRKATDQGRADFQYGLGLLYINGQEVPQNYAEAEKWFRKAAEQGYAKAQHKLGLLYYSGRQSDPSKWMRLAPSLGISFAVGNPLLINFNALNTPQNYNEAARWFRKAADQGNAPAQNNMGLLYERGQGVQQDYAEAARWYQKAADQEFYFAQYNLGMLYESGHGVAQNYAEAARWFRRAASHGFDYANNSLDKLATVDTDSRKLLRISAERGNAQAQDKLGIVYAQGQGVPKDYSEAAKWWLRAADQGQSGAQLDLGLLYENGWGVQKNLVIAYALYYLASANNSDALRLASTMKESEINEAQIITQEMRKPGNLSKAIIQYLAKKPLTGE